MFAYIIGTLKHIHNEYLILETANIGYRINTSRSTIQDIGTLESTVKLYTHLHLREDLMALYGFSTQEELKVFELLISVSGVGPKAAVAVTSAISPVKFSLAVASNDYSTLTSAQGIGKKTAQRIILELKDKIKKIQFENDCLTSTDQCSIINQVKPLDDAVTALIFLGYTEKEACTAVSKVNSCDGTHLNTVEDTIKEALKHLIKGG